MCRHLWEVMDRSGSRWAYADVYSRLVHIYREGAVRMADLSAKRDVVRTAVAVGRLQTTAQVVSLVRADNLPKADVLSTARIAGIAGAKDASRLIPLCHWLPLAAVSVDFGFTDTDITIRTSVRNIGSTGVEMEALTAAAIAGMALHDMVKAVDPSATLDGVRVIEKDGREFG